MKLLEIKNLSKSFDGVEVIRDISFDVDKGDVVAVIGSSGSGKTTLLRCATMLETVSGGSIYYNGDCMVETVNGEVRYASKEELKNIRRRYGLVFQNFNLFPHMSVMDNILEAPVHAFKQPREQMEQTARELLAQMGLEDKEKAYPCQLSGGQQQRVAIARALALQPDVLFFDEPTSALDPELTGEVLKSIRDLKKQGCTMIIVTHEMDFARHVADRIIYMANGVIEEMGTPDQIFNDPQSEKTRAFLNNAVERSIEDEPLCK